MLNSQHYPMLIKESCFKTALEYPDSTLQSWIDDATKLATMEHFTHVSAKIGEELGYEWHFDTQTSTSNNQ